MDCCCCWNSWNVWAGVRQECERYMHSLVDAIILCLLTHSEIASSCFEYLSTLFLSHNRSFALSFTRNMCCASLILVFFLLNSASHCVFTESENWKFTYGNKKKKKNRKFLWKQPNILCLFFVDVLFLHSVCEGCKLMNSNVCLFCAFVMCFLSIDNVLALSSACRMIYTRIIDKINKRKNPLRIVPPTLVKWKSVIRCAIFKPSIPLFPSCHRCLSFSLQFCLPFFPSFACQSFATFFFFFPLFLSFLWTLKVHLT